MLKFFSYFFFCLPFTALALNITATVDKSEVALNEPFIFTIKIQSYGNEPKNWNIPNIDFNDFHLLSQWSGRESSTQIINGEIERMSSFSKNYKLQAKTIGTLRIEPVTVKTYNKKLTTDPVFITVHKKSNKKNPPPSSPLQNPIWNLPHPFQAPNSLFDIFDNPLRQSTGANNVHLKLDLNKTSVYKSEMIRANWLILQSSDSLRYDIHQPPSLKGFWKEEIRSINRNSSAGTVIIDKVLYKKTPLNSIWLFPMQTGKLTIDSYSIRVRALFGFHSQAQIKSSAPKQITVKNLPLKGRDKSWTGAVGSFKVRAFIKEKTAKVNQPVSYNIHFKGSGHPRFIHLPPMPFPSSMQTYPPVEKSDFSDSGEGTKNFEILIVPKEEGVLTTPAFKLSTFEPKTGQYIFHEIPSFSLKVEKGEMNTDPGQTFFEKETVSEKQTVSFEPLNKFYWPSFLHHKNLLKLWFILFCIFTLGLILLCLKHFSFKKEQSIKDKVQKKFLDIQELIDKKEWKKACVQMIQVNDFVLQTAQIKGSSSSWRQALENLPPSLNKKYAPPFESLFRNLENLSFSSQDRFEEEGLAKAQALFQQTKNLIHSLLSEI